MSAAAWPEGLYPSTSSFWLEANTARNESPLNRSTQVLVRQGARWRCDLTFESRNRDVSARLDALLAFLDGSGGEVLLHDFRRPLPRGQASLLSAPITTVFTDGTEFHDHYAFVDAYAAAHPMVVADVGAGSDVLPTGGWGPREYALRAGDYIGINGNLYMVGSDMRTDLAGIGPVQIRPRLRGPVHLGDIILVERPTARFRLADNSQGANRTAPGFFSSYTVSFTESLP